MVRELLELYNAVKEVYDEGSSSVTACTNATNITDVLANDPRLAWHMGATFLLANAQPRKEFTQPEQLGHLGLVIFNLYPSSTLTPSPLQSMNPRNPTRQLGRKHVQVWQLKQLLSIRRSLTEYVALELQLELVLMPILISS